MKKTLQFARWELLLSLAAVMLLGGCAAHKHDQQLGKQDDLVYDTAKQLEAMPACRAVVVERGPCYVRLKRSDGSAFLVGSPAADADVVQFLQVLKDGEKYQFPDAFQKYQEQRRPAGQ